MSHASLPTRASARRSPPLTGRIRIPGDKSISHRALMLSSQVLGPTTITGLLEGEDVLATADALRALGVRVERHTDGSYRVDGVGIGGLAEPERPLDMGNAGTGARLLMGLLASYPFLSVFIGDKSLSRRPMKRVIDPLTRIGASFMSRGGRLPLAMTGSEMPLPIEYVLPVASAQVKSAVLLAGLNIAGRTSVIEKEATRDHTERMLRSFGIAVDTETLSDGSVRISLDGHQDTAYAERLIDVPGDPSSAAFPIVAAAIVPGSNVIIERVCINPLRTGLFTTLREMGADLTFENEREIAGEPVADIRVRHSALRGVEVPAERAPSMIDEYPVLSVAAAYAQGETIMRGLGELRVKESDRLAAVAAGLEANGVSHRIDGDDLIVTGGTARGGGSVVTHYDHRIAMSFLIMGLAAENEVMVDDTRAIATSFPGFIELMTGIGADAGLLDVAMVKSGKSKSRVIAIDGPAASGKGTLARRIADHYGYGYLDTGSLYRAVGLKLVYSDRDPNDAAAALDAARSIGDRDLTNPRLRQERIAKAASIVSAMPDVRAALLDFQREYACRAEGAVLDGRDIGTVVCPDADIKIYVKADLKTRAERRYRELLGEGIEVVYDSVLRDLKERDERDSKRAAAPLVAADDAVIIDTTDHSAQEVFEQVLALIENGNLSS